MQRTPAQQQQHNREVKLMQDRMMEALDQLAQKMRRSPMTAINEEVGGQGLNHYADMVMHQIHFVTDVIPGKLEATK